MSTSKLKQLKSAADKAMESKKDEDRSLALTQAFELFNQESARLEHAYQQLKQDYETVNQRLIQKVLELDIATSYFKKIISNMSQGLLFVNQMGIITTYNQAAERLLGLQATEVLFQRYDHVFEDRYFGFSMGEALRNQRTPDQSFLLIEHNNLLLELEVDTCFMTKASGQPPITTRDEELDFTQGLILFFRDITKEQQLKRQTERNDRMKELGEMAALVAHEIRNPLGGIKGFASLLKRDLDNNPELQKMANYIMQGAETLNQRLTQILHFARPLQLNIEQAELAQLLREVLLAVQMDEKLKKGIAFHSSGLDRLVAPVDVQLLKSALLNLIVNGIQAMPEGGKLSLTLDSDARNAKISISDTGGGIPNEIREKIFRPFFTTKSEGSGFGLTEAQKIIQAHGGTVEMASEINKGTTFTLKLPLKGV